MESIWRKTTRIEEGKPLAGNLQVKAAVIGGGMAGMLIAYFLKKKGVEAVVLEAGGIAGGQTGNTTAKITSQHNLIYHSLIRGKGEEAAAQYARANQQAIEEYAGLIRERGIECEFQRVPAYLYSTAEAYPLEREAEAAKRLGIPAEFTLETKLPFPIKGAVKFHDQAQFHPLKFLKALSEELTVYGGTFVQSVEGNRIATRGGEVEAEHIIFATHYPFINMPGYYFLRMHQERSYVVALEHAARLDGVYLGVDPEGLSFRNSGELLLLGGGSHRTGENSAGGRYDALRAQARMFWPQSVERAYWSAQDCMSLDQVPYIGRYSSSAPNWYAATGFGKWGMTGSMVSAMIISDLVTGRENPNEEVFSPQRLDLFSSAKTLAKEGAQAAKGLSRRLLSPPKAALDALPLGHGGIVEVEGEKAGVYKDQDGRTYVISPRCPHLGCQLEWNPDELSWDCPCHGSRFDYKGNLLNNPAQEGLLRI